MALFKKRTVGKPGEWYYCLEHKKVEEGPECPAQGPLRPVRHRGGGRARHGDGPGAERWSGRPTPAGTTRPPARTAGPAGS